MPTARAATPAPQDSTAARRAQRSALHARWELTIPLSEPTAVACV